MSVVRTYRELLFDGHMDGDGNHIEGPDPNDTGLRFTIKAELGGFEVGTLTVGPVRPRFRRSYILDGDGPGGLFIPRRIAPAKRRRSRRRARRDRRGW